MKKIIFSFFMVIALHGVAGAETVTRGELKKLEPVIVDEKIVGRKYIVKKGDTLWDLTNRFYSNSFRWPSLWRENVFIENPNLIYPGDVLLVYLENGEGAYVVRKKILQRVEQVHKSFTPLQNTGYIQTQNSMLGNGNIQASYDGRTIISTNDKVYIRSDAGIDYVVGDRLIIFRKEKEVFHPITGARFGDLIKIVGVLEVKEEKDRYMVATVVETFGQIWVGDWLGFEDDMIKDASENLAMDVSGSEAGVVVASNDGREGSAQFDIVYLDIGGDVGVFPGDDYNIIRNIDKADGNFSVTGFPIEGKIVGELQIVSVQKEASVGRITKSIDVVFKGDFIERKSLYAK